MTNYVARMQEASAAGTIDKRKERHISWTDAPLDKQGCDETIEDFKNFVNRLPGRIAESAVRLRTSGGEEIRATVGLTCFESPTLARDEKSQT